VDLTVIVELLVRRSALASVSISLTKVGGTEKPITLEVLATFIDLADGFNLVRRFAITVTYYAGPLPSVAA
jgi:hypothetical protein